MSVFWIAAALMVLAALGFLVWPLSRGQERTKHDSRAINVALYREQLRELQADLASGSLSEEQYRESVSELERNLLQDVSSPATKPAVRKKNSPLIVASAALLPLFAIALYLAVGNPQSLTPKPQETAQAMLQQLQQHLKENPDDAEGWALLASVHFELERYADAVSYFEKAVTLRPGDAQLLADYADALARANEGRLEGKPVALLEKSLQADPGNIKALALSGAAAYGAGDFKSAADYWQRLLAKMPARSEETKLVQERIDDARSRATANTGINVRGAIRGTVSVSPNLEGQVGPDDTLFVYAQAGDSKMPLSIVRARAKELPYSFVLDDSKGMAGGVKLSSANEVRVVARISKSGQAQSRSGDLQGVSASVKPGAREVKIVIDQVIGAEASK